MGFKNLVYGIYSIISFKQFPCSIPYIILLLVYIPSYCMVSHYLIFVLISICAIQFGTIIIVNNYDSLKLIDISMIYTMLHIFDSGRTNPILLR